jgi:two-component system sensor histidine kinase TctE
MAKSLRGELLAWLLAPLSVVVAFNIWTTYSDALRTANLVTDRTLLASARVIAEQIKDVDGYVEVTIPPAALEMFASPARDFVVYRVIAPSGELIAGFPDPIGPPVAVNDLQPVFFQSRFRIDPIRAVAIAQPVVSKNTSANALVIVGETLRGRDSLVKELWWKALQDQVLLVAAVGLLIIIGLRRGLAPLSALGRELLARDPASLRPLPTKDIPRELFPLADALNHALARVQTYIDLQRRFIANASHRMRTPLAVLKTQAAVGLREPETAAKQEALTAIGRGVDALTRLVNQLLTLARAEPGGAALRKEDVDFVAITRNVLAQLAPVALDRRMDLHFETDMPAAWIFGHQGLLQELVVNLMDNALRYAPEGGLIAVSLRERGGHAVLRVEDNGPGIPVSERTKVFERFYRLPSDTTEGTGLGLAIVREIVIAHGGEIALSTREPPPGLVVEITLPLRAKENAAASAAAST